MLSHPSAGSHKVTLKHQNVQKLTSVCPEDFIYSPRPYINQRKARLVPSGSPLLDFGFRMVREARVAREVREVREVKKAGEVGEAWVVMVVSRVTD